MILSYFFFFFLLMAKHSFLLEFKFSKLEAEILHLCEFKVIWGLLVLFWHFLLFWLRVFWLFLFGLICGFWCGFVLFFSLVGYFFFVFHTGKLFSPTYILLFKVNNTGSSFFSIQVMFFSSLTIPIAIL